jgi:hypothetical protein
LLGKDLETNNETRLYNNTVTFGNGVMQPVVRQLQQVGYNNGNVGVFYVVRAEGYKKDNWDDPVTREQAVEFRSCQSSGVLYGRL